MAVGSTGDGSGGVWTSPDGESWTQHPIEPVPALRAVAFGDGRYLAAGDRGTLLVSGDGVHWQRRSAGIHVDLFAALAANGRMLALGYSGTIVMSEQ